MVIIPISTQIINHEETNSVNARDLHHNLGVKKKFADWIKSQISSLYLEENKDYILISPKRELGSRGGDMKSVDYIITADTAKGIAMASRTEKGNEVRKYFIAVEKRYQVEIAEPKPHVLTHKEAIKNLARAEIKRLEEVIAECESTIKVSRAEKSHYDKLFHESRVGIAYTGYTTEEERLLRDWSREGKNSRQIGEYLNRTPNAIRNKIGKMKRTGAW